MFEKVKWPSDPKGQDVGFNKMVYARFTHCVVVKEPLLAYRNYLSSWRCTDLVYNHKGGKKGLSKLYAVKVIVNAMS